MASSLKSAKSAKRTNALVDSANSMKQLMKDTSGAGNPSRMMASAKSTTSTGVAADKEDRIQQNNDAAKAILKKLNGTVVDLEEHFRKEGSKSLAMIKAAKESNRDEEVLKVQWQSVVEQAKTDMRKEHSVASRQDKTATYMNVMRDLRLANRNPVLDYLLVHFTQPDEDALCHGAIENLLRWFDSATKLVIGTIDAPKHVDRNAGLQQLAFDVDESDDKGFDPRAEAIAEWREISQLVYKIGREQEAFTEISANMMKRTVDGVQRMDPEGVKKAKAAMHKMSSVFQQAVKEMLTVNDVLEDEDEMNRMIEEWDKILANGIGDKKKLEQLEAAVVTLEDELQASQMKLHRLQREVEQSSHEAEKRQHEAETMYEVISDERDRVMLSNESLKNEIEDLQSRLDTALMKANYVDALNRDKERLNVLKDQLERKVADLETDMVDYKESTAQQQKEFKELMKEIKIARDAKEAQIQLEAEHVELQASHQTAIGKIEEMRNNVARVEASAELNIQEAVKKAQEEADAAAAAESEKMKQLSFDLQDSQGKNKALKQKLKAAEESLAKAGKNAPAPAEPPEPAEPQVIGVTEESTVEEVLDVLRGFQESTLRSPFSRAEFVEGLDDFMSEALRDDMVEQLRKTHPGIFAPVPPLNLPDPDAEAADPAAEEADSKQVSCRDDNSVIESHRTAQDESKDQVIHVTHAAPKPPTVDAMVNTDASTLKEAESQTDDVALLTGDDERVDDGAQQENKTVDRGDCGEGDSGEGNGGEGKVDDDTGGEGKGGKGNVNGGNGGAGKVDEGVDACWLGIVTENEATAVEKMMAEELATNIVATELTVVADLTVQLETVKTEREAARMESQLLTEKLAAAQQLADTAAGQLAEVEASLQSSGTESAGSELARLQLQRQLNEQTQLRQRLEEEISASSVSELVTKVELSGVQEEREQLQSERDQLQSERDQLHSEKNQLHTARDDLQASRDLLQSKHDKLLVDYAQLQTDSDEIRDRIKELEELVHDLMNDSSDVEEKSKAALEAIKAQADSKLNTERRTLEAEMAELKLTLKAVEAEKEELQEQIAQLQAELLAVTESSSGEGQQMQRELMARRKSLASAKTRAKQLEDSLQAREQAQNDLQAHHAIVLDDAEKRYQELETSYQELESSSKQLQATLNETRSELNDVREELIRWQDASEPGQAPAAILLDAETGIDSDLETEEKPVIVETMMQTEGVEYLQNATQTEVKCVAVDDVNRVVSAGLADAEEQLARLAARLQGLDLLEKRLDDMWNVSAVEGAALNKAVEQIEDKSLALLKSVDGMQRDFSGVLALFPPMDVTVGETDAARVMPWNSDSSIAGQKGSPGALPSIQQRSNPAALAQDVTCGGMLPVFNGGNVSETKDKLGRSVELLTEVANDIKQPEMKKKTDELIQTYSQLQQQIEFSTAAGEPSTKDQLEQIEIGTKQANIKFAKLMSSKGFQETVKDKITEWEGEISHSAGISNDMQLRYENARRKSLAKMAALLIENQKKAEMLYSSVSHASTLNARFAGGGHAAPDSWADTMGLYHGSGTPKKQSDAGYQGRQRFYSVNIGGEGLADDWSRSHRAPTAPKGGKPNSNQGVEDLSEVVFGWKANTESPPLTDRSRGPRHSSHHEDQGMDLKLPPLKNAPARSKAKSKEKKQPVYEVKLRQAPKLGLLGNSKA